ncbi:MAG: hypothetical protein A2061_03895 [Gallionellales bacterium GWA2_59_43]|nr:MAG: hypothetical protein A2061_03895 [Gallionellales bacterium GWA2_59_43]
MQRITMHPNPMLALLFAGMLATGLAFADKPDWAGGDKSAKHQQSSEEQPSHNRKHDADGTSVSVYFNDDQRTVIREYFDGQSRAGRCPPGLAKKHNGCMPPGQAKKWTKGRPLPRDVVFYSLPSGVAVKLGAPPAGHRYVRVAADILLIAIGTGMVVDAIEDLGNM